MWALGMQLPIYQVVLDVLVFFECDFLFLLSWLQLREYLDGLFLLLLFSADLGTYGGLVISP